MNNITFVVSTFERPDCLKNLIRSIKKYYPDIPILVADDSEDKNDVNGVEYYRLEFDSGLSVKRNFLVNKVKTKYFLLLDDDFTFTEKTNIEELVRVAELGFDIVGGKVQGLEYNGLLELNEGVLRYVKGTRGNYMDYPIYDIVLNFFVGKTEAVKSIGWDDELKLAEHSAFFLRAKGILRTTCVDSVEVNHDKVREGKYSKYRVRGNIFFQIFMKKMGITEVIDFNGKILKRKEEIPSTVVEAKEDFWIERK